MTRRDYASSARNRFRRSVLLVALATLLAMVVAGCGNENSPLAGTQPPATTTTTTTPATTTTSTSTTSTTTTTTLPPTTTTTLPPLPVVGWDGPGVSALAVVVDFEHGSARSDMVSIVVSALRALDIDVEDESQTTMALALTGWGNSASYEDIGTCYTGAHIQGTLTLTSPGQTTIEVWVSGDRPLEWLIFSSECATQPENAPYADAFERPLVEAVVEIWGVGSLPLLLEVMGRPLQNSQVDLPLWAAVADAFGSFDPAGIDLEDTYHFLESTIDVLEETLDLSDHGFHAAARRLLTSYSGTDFGFADETDILEWRDWLDDWTAEQ